MNKTNGQQSDIPDSIHLLHEVEKILVEKKCEAIRILDLTKVNSYLSYFVIATANSGMQASAAAKDIQKLMKPLHMGPGNTERGGHKTQSGWILLDHGEIIIHIMSPEKRAFYNLDRLWSDAIEIPLQESI